jgi:hypothetical protein
MPPGDGEAGAPLSARGYVELVDGVLDDGTQRWQPIEGSSHNDGT